MEALKFYYQVVEKAIAQIGLNPEIARKEMGKWTITKGNIPVWIDIFYREQEKRGYFMVGAPIMDIPSQNASTLAIDLLHLNNELFGVAFVANKNRVFLKTIRETNGLDISEAHAMILRIGNYAEKYSKELKEKYPDWKPLDAQSNFTNN